MCLASKKSDSSSNPICKIQAHLMKIPITHGVAPDHQLVCYDCPIYKKPGYFRSKQLCLVHGVEATENQALKISVAWEIKKIDDIFYEFQFGRPYQTCLSAIILKELAIDSFMLTKTPGIVIDNFRKSYLWHRSDCSPQYWLHYVGHHNFWHYMEQA
jgi:hypothetical protein